MTQDYSNKITFPLLPYALPLSFGSNLILFLSLIPFIVLWYFYSNTWLGEGILVVPMLIIYLYFRYKLSKKEHYQVDPVTLTNGTLFLPSNLSRNKQQINLNISEIKEIKFTKLPGRGTRIIKSWFRVIITDNYNRNMKISGFAMDLNNFEQEIKKYNPKISYVIDPLFKWVTPLIIIIALLFFYYLFFINV